MPRLFVDLDPEDGERGVVDGDGARHLRALRLIEGGTFEAIVGPGVVRAATIERFERRGARIRLGAPVPTGDTDPTREIVLAVALADLGRFDTVIEKGTELGATRILPLRTERTQVGKLTDARRERWQRIARAACEQCGRTVPPEIGVATALDEATTMLPPDAACIVLSPTATEPWNGNVPKAGPLALFIGPEGGLSPGEVQALETAGAEARSLGPRVLRFETAAVAALAIAAAR